MNMDKAKFEFDDESRENPIGSILRYHREQRKLDLDRIAEQLRIRPAYLEAMEQNRFDLLPSGVYRRSFLKAYAQFLKLDPDQILKMFDDLEGKEEEEKRELRPPRMKAPALETLEAKEVHKEGISFQTVSSFLRLPFKLSRSGLLLLGVLSLVIVVVVLIFLLKVGRGKKGTSSSGSETATSESLTVNTQPVDTLALFAKMVEDSIGRAPEWTLRVSAAGECWMNLESDGKRLFSAMVFEKMNLEFRAKESFTIYSGKNQGLRLWLNGFELKSPPNGVTNLNRQNFKEFISSDNANERVRTHEQNMGRISPPKTS
ncbi:MAG: helix-turn-helix transcriptional regulator [Candidatus Zixiibacteriota bacterium]